MIYVSAGKCPTEREVLQAVLSTNSSAISLAAISSVTSTAVIAKHDRTLGYNEDENVVSYIFIYNFFIMILKSYILYLNHSLDTANGS